MFKKVTFAGLAALAINSFSACLAAGGALAILRRSASVIDFANTLAANLPPMTGDHLLMAVSLLAGSVVQVMLVAAWKNYLRERDVLFFGIGLVMSGLSAWMSATTAVYFAHGATIDRNLRAEATAPAVAGLQVGSDKMRDVAAAGRALATEAARLKKKEVDEGMTCDDVTTKSGTGKVQRLRNRHEKTAAEVSQRIDAISGTVFGYAIDIVTAGEAEAQALYGKALRLTRSPEITAVINDLAAMRGDVTATYWDDTTNAAYSCKTPAFAAMIADVETKLQDALQIEIHDVRATEVGIGDASALLMADIWAWATGDRAALPTAGRGTLLFVAIVELIQLIALVGDYRQRRRRGHEPDCWDRFDATGGTPMPPEAKARYEQVLAALDRLTLRTEGRLWLVHGDGPLAEAARVAIDFLNLDTDRAHAAGHVRDVPLAQIMPGWVEQRSEVLTGEAFTLYRLPRGIDAWRRRVRRDVQR